MKRTLFTLAALAIAANFTNAHATVLGSAPLFGGASQISVTCYLYNTGTSNVGLGAVAVLTQNGAANTIVANTCSTALGAKKLCAYYANVNNATAYSCAAPITTGTPSQLRGTMDIRKSDGTVLGNAIIH